MKKTQLDSGEWRHDCELCGAVYVGRANWRHICRKPCAECGEKALPGLARQAANLAAAAGKVAGAVVALKPVMRSSEAVADCLAICGDCPAYRQTDGRCAECGCFVAIKAGLASEECPLGKWPLSLDDTNEVAGRLALDLLTEPTASG